MERMKRLDLNLRKNHGQKYNKLQRRQELRGRSTRCALTFDGVATYDQPPSENTRKCRYTSISMGFMALVE